LSQFQSVSHSRSFSTLRLELISSLVIIIALPTPWAEDVEANMAEEEHTKEVDMVQTQDVVTPDAAVEEVVAMEAVMMLSSARSVARETTLQLNVGVGMMNLISQVRTINQIRNLLLPQIPTNMIQTGMWTPAQPTI
jgi:hypothetical protein